MVFIPRFIFYIFSCALACFVYQHKSMQKSCKPVMLGRIWQASRRALNLEHSRTHQFACSQWQTGEKPSNFYILYRWLFFIAVTSTAIASFTCQRPPKCDLTRLPPAHEVNRFKWFIYFTNWGFLMIVVQSALALVVVHKCKAAMTYNMPNESTQVRTPLICRAYWLAYNVATDLAFVITLMYWSTVYDPIKHELDALNLLVHAGNSVMMLCEVGVCAHPVRFAHALYGAGAGLAYGVFSAVYAAAGGTNRCDKIPIYDKLDWEKPGMALAFVAVSAVVLVVAHMFVTLLALARTRLAFRPNQPPPFQSEFLTYTD